MPSFDTSDGVTLHSSDTGAAARSGPSVVLVAGQDWRDVVARTQPDADRLRGPGHTAVTAQRAGERAPREADGLALGRVCP
jgi:hypothetical protein